MISAIVLSPSLRAGQNVERAPEAVARSLGALVRAAVDGVLRDVAIVGPPDEALAELADHAGCAFVEADSTRAGFALALQQIKGDVIFVLEGGFAPSGGFAEEAGDLLRQSGKFNGALLRLAPHSLTTRLAPALSRAVGVLVFRQALVAAAPRDLADLVRRLNIRRALRVRAEKTI